MVRSLSLSEREFENQVRELARIYHWCGFHISFSHGSVTGVHTHGLGDDHYDSDGFPDWIFLRGDRILFRELKRESGVISLPQKRWILQLTQAGQDVKVWRPSDMKEIVATFMAA